MAVTSKHRRRWFSPLSLRILAVNVIALGILGGGVLYLNQFRDELVERRLDEIRTQSRIIAGALGEAATGGPDATSVDLEAARRILGRLVGRSALRARLFDTEGALVADSRFMFLGGSVIATELPPPNAEPSLRQRVEAWLDQALAQIAEPPALPPYQERPDQSAADYEEVQTALTGEMAARTRVMADGTPVITVAAPVQRFRRVLGALLVSTDISDIEDLVRSERWTILKVFGVSLAVTLMLSLFLAGTIARPIRRLAAAADRIRGGMGRQVRLPDYTRRGDEIGDLTRSFADMTQALYRQIDAVESFAADVAHEIKNPLSSLRSAVETVERSTDPEIQNKLLGIIKDDVRRLDRLISDISDASRLDAELSRGKMTEVDLPVLLATLVDIYRSTGRGNGADIRFDNQASARLCVAGIEGRLGQVVRNILENALSFSPAGGAITIGLRQSGRQAVISIDDEGPGLPQQNVKDIFKRFYSERPANEAFGTHSGLGLSISKQIVEAHGGTIRAENRVEDGDIKGARFIIELPISS